MTDSGLTDFDLYLFGEGRHEHIYEKLGAHPYAAPGAAAGTRFADARFGGSSYNRQMEAGAAHEGAQGYPYSLRLNFPPLGAMFFIGPV